jgi:hypothetical protein
MLMKKKCEPCYVVHPVICGAVAGLAVIGLVGVALAIRRKGKCWGRTAKDFGNACIDSIEEKAEDLMQKSMDAMKHMNKSCLC